MVAMKDKAQAEAENKAEASSSLSSASPSPYRTLSDAETGALPEVQWQGMPVVESDAGVQNTFRRAYEDELVRQIEEEENAKEGRFANSPTWTLRDQLEYSRLDSAGRLFLEHPEEHGDSEFGAILDELNRRRFGIPAKIMTAFDRPGDEHGNQARLREFFAFADRVAAAKSAKEQQGIMAETYAKAMPELAAWEEAKRGADGGAAFARAYLGKHGRDWGDAAKGWLGAANPNAWLDYAFDPAGTVAKPTAEPSDAEAIAETEAKFANDRVLMNVAKVAPFLPKGQRDFVNLAAAGAPREMLEGVLYTMAPDDRDFMRSLAQGVRPAHEDLPWLPDVAAMRVGRSVRGVLRDAKHMAKMAGVYLGGAAYVSWGDGGVRFAHLAPGTREEMNRLRDEIAEDVKNYEALGMTKFGDASDFADKAVAGFFDSASLQIAALAGAGLRMGGASLAKAGSKWGVAAEGAGWALEGWTAVSMVGEHFHNLVMNGVDMEWAVPLSLYVGVGNAMIENANVPTWFGGRLSPTEARYAGFRGAVRMLRRHGWTDLRRTFAANAKLAFGIVESELKEEIAQALNDRAGISIAEGRGVLDAYTNSDAGRAMRDAFVEALPTCTMFGLVGMGDVSGHARRGGIASYRDNLEQIAREVAAAEGADALDAAVVDRYVAQVKNRADQFARATKDMTPAQRAAYAAMPSLRLTPAEQAFLVEHCRFYDALAAQDGALYAARVAGGSLNEALFERAGWKFEHAPDGSVSHIVSPDGKVNERVRALNRSATIDDFDDAMLHDFVAEWNALVADGELEGEAPFPEVGESSAKADVAAWSEADRARLEKAVVEQTPGFINADGITLFLGAKDASGGRRAEAALAHEVMHSLLTRLENTASKESRKAVRALAASLGRSYDEAQARMGEAAALDEAKSAIENALPDGIDWKAVGRNAMEIARRVFSLGLYQGDFKPAFSSASTSPSIDPAAHFERIVGQVMLDLKELQERQKTEKEEHRKLVAKILADRTAKRRRKIEMRAAERAAENRADREAAEAEARRVEGERRAEEARVAAENRERERRDLQFFLNRQSNVPPRLAVAPHLVGEGTEADAEQTARAIPAYRILWKVAKKQNLTDAEKAALGETYGIPAEALTNPESISDADMARLQDGLTRLWTDASNARIVVPPVFVATAADAHRILPNEVYDPVFQTFRVGEVVVDAERAEPFTPATAPGSAQERAEDAPYVTDEETPAPGVPAASRAPVGGREVRPAPREDTFKWKTTKKRKIVGADGQPVRDERGRARTEEVVEEHALPGGLWNFLHKPFAHDAESPTPSRQDREGHGLWNGRALPASVAAALESWANHCPKYMGNKNAMLKRVVQAICNNFTSAERNAYTRLNDCFGGGGCWGLSIAMTALPNVRNVVVNEFDERRLEKIRLLHTLDGRMEAKMRDFVGRRNVVGRVNSMLRDRGISLTRNGLRTRKWIYETMNGEIDAMSAEDKGLLWALLDNVQSMMNFGKQDAHGQYTVDAIVEYAVKDVGKDAVKATELANAFKERGGEIVYSAGDAKRQADFGVRLDADGVYRRGAAGEPLAVPHGADVMSVADPPYYRTGGYGDGGERTRVGLAADPAGWWYADTKAMLDALVDLRDGIVYTDEAWWFKPKYRFDESKIAEEEQILGGIMDVFDHFDVAGGVAGRQETLGVQHGRENAEETHAAAEPALGEVADGQDAGADDHGGRPDDGRGVRPVLEPPVRGVDAGAEGQDGNAPRPDGGGDRPRIWDGDAATLADAVADGWEIPRRLRGYANRLLEEADEAQRSHEARVNADLMAATRFSITPRNAATALKFHLAREIMMNGGRLPDSRHAKLVARSFGIAGDVSPHLEAAEREAETQTRVLRYVASDPKVERVVAAAGKSARYEAAIRRARSAAIKFSKDVSDAAASAETSLERAVRAVRGEDYETMVRREGVDLNAVLLAMRPDEKPPKAHAKTEAEEGATPSEAPDAEAEAHAAALAERTIERAKELVAEAKQAAAEREEERATRPKSGRAQEAAEDAAGSEEEGGADEEDAAPGETAFSKAYRRAIRESGITLDNPAQVVQLVKALTKKHILENPAEVSDLDPADVFASPIARAMFAGNLASFAQDVAAAYSPSHARIRVAKKCETLNAHGVNSAAAIERIGEEVFKDLNRDVIRQSRKSLIGEIRAIAKNPGRRFSEREEAQDRKVSADAARYCKFVTWALNVPAAKVEETMEQLEKFLDGYASDLDDAQKGRYKDYAEAQLKRSLLDLYGNLRARMPAELAQIRDRLGQMVDEGTFEAMCFSEKWEEARNAAVEAAVPAIVGNPRDKGVEPEPNWWSDWVYSLVGMFETKWRQLTRFCRDDAVRSRSLAAMSRVEEMIQSSEDAQFNYLAGQKAKLRDLLGRVYGGEKGARKALSAEVDPALWRSLDRGGQHTQWTVGRLLQMYASCVQSDYADNCEKHGRDGEYVAHLEEVIRALDPRHFALIDGLRSLYLEQGDALSEVMERTAGTRLYTPNRLYMPVQPLRVHDVAKRAEGRGYSPFAASLTPRVKHGLDFDQNADVLELFLDRAEAAAHTIGWADSGSMVLGVCQSDRILNAMRSAFGRKVMGQWNNYVFDVLAGKNTAPSGDESAPLRALARYASRLWIGLNAASWAKQVMSFPCFALSLDGSLKDVVCAGAFWTLRPVEAWRCAKDLASTRAFTARYGVAISQELKYATSTEGAFATWWQKAMNRAMSGVYALDKFTVYLQAGIYRRRRAQLEKNGMDAHEASETASTWLMHIVDKTAQTARTLNTTQLQRAGGAWAFMLQFKSAPVQQTQFEIVAAQETLASPADAKRWKKLAAVIAINHVVVPAMNTLIETSFAALVQGGMPDDEKRRRQLATLLGNMMSGSLGSIVALGVLVEGLSSALADKAVTGHANTAFHLSRERVPAFSVVNNAVGSYNRFAEALENLEWNDVSDTAIDMATAIGGVIPGVSWPARTIDKTRKRRVNVWRFRDGNRCGSTP